MGFFLERIKSVLDGIERAKINRNFDKIEKNFNNVVDVVSERAYSDVVDAARLEWKEPVDTFVNLTTVYPDAKEGWTSMARDTGMVYRYYRTTGWGPIQQISAGPVNEVDHRLSTQLAQKADKTEVNTLATIKADTAYVDNQIANEASQRQSDVQVLQLNLTSTEGRLAGKRNIADKIKNTDLDTSTDANKIKLVNLADEVQQAINGNAPALSVIPNSGVTNEKLANGSVYGDKISDAGINLTKTTIDLIPRKSYEWTNTATTFRVGDLGELPTTITEQISQSTYRKDTIELIKVRAGMKIKVTKAANSIFQVGVFEFDANQIAVKDSGYITNELTLTNNTRYIRFIVSKKDLSNFTIAELINNLDITAEVPFETLSRKIVSERKEKEQRENDNLLPLTYANWEQGSITVAEGAVAYNTDPTRIRLSSDINVTKLHKLYYNIPSGYFLSLIVLDSSGEVLRNTNWFEGEGFVILRLKATSVKVILRKSDNRAITIDDINKISVMLSINISSFKRTSIDVNYALESLRSNQNKMFNQFKNKLHYIGHSGTQVYAPENTLEAYRVASETMRVWGAECDLALTSDNELVLMHDFTLDRTTTGTGNVRDHTLAQIKALHILGYPDIKVPTFKEYLVVCKEYGLFPVIEIKNSADASITIDLALGLLSDFKMLDNCIIISFNQGMLQSVRSKNKNVYLGLLINIGGTVTADTMYFLKRVGNCALNLYANDITEQSVSNYHDNEVLVMAWAVDDKALAQTLVSYNVDMITTNMKVNDLRESLFSFD